MFRYIIPLPFYLKFGSTQTFDLQLPEKTIKLRFLNPEKFTLPPFPTTHLGIDSETRLEPDDLESVRLFANNIFRAYRLVTEETFNVGTITQLAKHQFHSAILYGEVDEQGNFVQPPRLISYLRKLETGIIEEQKYSEIKQLVDSPSLILERTYDEILLQAKSFFEQENFRMAILEAVIALEIVVSSIIRRLAAEKGISEDDTENFMVNVGLTGELKIVLRLLILESLPTEEVMSGCKGAISIRNDIIHRERLSVSQREAEDAINNIEMFINHVRPLMRRRAEPP
jgi:hypothetical protein